MSQIDHAKYIRTVFCDIDGCILKHHGDIAEITTGSCILLPGVLETFKEWVFKGYTIILTTGRLESMREVTEQQLSDCGICYDQLVMGLPRGLRVVINDIKPNSSSPTASGINLERDKGMNDVNI